MLFLVARPGRTMQSTESEGQMYDVKRVEYYTTTIEEHVGDASRLLARIAGAGVDFFAFRAVRAGPGQVQFSLMATDPQQMTDAAERSGLELDGPSPALLVRGDEVPGALAAIYERLARAGVEVRESSGIAHIKGGYGVLLYLASEDREKAVAALEG